MNEQKETTKVADSIGLIAGLWLILYPFVSGLTGTFLATSEYVIGFVVAVLSLIKLFSEVRGTWVSWVDGVLGLWLLFSPLFIAGMLMGSIWNNILLGIVLLVVAVWSGASSTMSRGHPKMG